MQQVPSNKPSEFDDEIDLSELFYVLFNGKWIIVSLTAYIDYWGYLQPPLA
jgi:LPS O-antigen subunit length determinant protein (WzzB/FepE family)